MHRLLVSRFGKTLLALALLVTTLAVGGGVRAEAKSINVNSNQEYGAVYVLTNQTAGNNVMAYDRASDGSLTAAGSYSTGGLGTGSSLGSQGALALSQDNRWLFAVNAGSNEVSVFAVSNSGLTLTDRLASSGTDPTSVTSSHGLVYVLNAGGSGNISGFKVEQNGQLTAIPNAIRPLSGNATGPAEVRFSPNGDLLVVTEKATNSLDTYSVGRNGVANGPTTYAAAGVTPYGFAFGNRSDIVVSEAFGGAPNGSAASSYSIGRDGALNVVSASSTTHQTAACWVVATGNGRYAYTANAGSGSITGYSVAPDDSLSLLNPDGRTGVTGDGTTPTDMGLSNNSQFLYVLTSGSHGISGFAVNSDGSLTATGSISGLPAGTVGLAAR
jgi:6-phosphogluconolactonase